MSMLDAFFKQGFKAAKCKTLLKLTIPRIKLLRNRREIQIKQMRKDIAKLLETGQEATARIRVEHIVREENMMAAQEIIELFCELIAVRLPIIEAQRECPLDLKEAISSVCFAAPRCADLPELQQVQMLFASKYGKEFLSAATELMPNCGVNRQLIELLSIRAPAPEKKLKLLKEIAEEHGLEWDPSPSESEFYKPHEDLLNGSTQFVSGSKIPLPKEKHDDTLYSTTDLSYNEESDPDETLDFPEVPKVSIQPIINTASAPVMVPPIPAEVHDESSKKHDELDIEEPKEEVEQERSVGSVENKQFVPFISPPSFPTTQSNSPPPNSRTKSETNVDLEEVLAAAHAAADSAERAAAAARSAASLAQVRITELIKKNDLASEENPFHTEEKKHLNLQNSFGDAEGVSYSSFDPHQDLEGIPSFDEPKMGFDSSFSDDHVVNHNPDRISSVEDDPYYSYPNLFTSQGSGSHSFTDNSRSTD